MRHLLWNLRLGFALMLVPLTFAVVAFLFIFNGQYQLLLSRVGAERITTKNWQTANAAFLQNEPQYDRHYAYYKVRPGQTLASLAAHFGVPAAELASLNPGSVLPGTTIKVPPVEQPFTPQSGPQNQTLANVSEATGIVYVENLSFSRPQVVLNIPTLMQLTQPYGAVSQTGPKNFTIVKPITLRGNIRLDITNATVDRLALLSGKAYGITALTFWDAEGLIENTSITTVDPASKQPDTNTADGRSFLRAYGNSRLDIINSKLSYLGMGAQDAKQQKNPLVKELIRQGGTSGVSWRIPNKGYGQEVATGWVQNATFTHDDIGSYTYGTSGMRWQQNTFSYNDTYGFEGRSNSNNALVTNNTFAYNGSDGFYLSQQSDYNLVENNTSYNNKKHGYVLRDQSSYNLLANNVAAQNTDNYVVYASDFTTLRSNKSFRPQNSSIRLSDNAADTFLVQNSLSGGRYGIYGYGGTRNLYISGNQIQQVRHPLRTDHADEVLFANNTISNLNLELQDKDRVIFGPNTIATVSLPTFRY